MNLKETVLANAAAVWVGGIYLVCALGVVLFPDLSRTLAVSWFHGIDLDKIWSGQPFPGNFWLGLVSAVGLAWLAVWLFARIYNFFSRR